MSFERSHYSVLKFYCPLNKMCSDARRMRIVDCLFLIILLVLYCHRKTE